MLAKKTVFIVGAGASHELDFPTGDVLRQEIAALLNITFPDGYNQKDGDYEIQQVLRNFASRKGLRDINGLLHKCWLIRDALPGSISIDNLLDAHRNDPEISQIGKLAIAKAILRAERKSKLFNKRDPHKPFKLADVAETWLIPLLQILTEGVPKEQARRIFDNVVFINFNYDRSLEYFLARAISIYYGFATPESEEICARARIIHPYGHVGKHGVPNPLATVSFGEDRYDLELIAQGIRTFTEGISDEGFGDEIKTAISSAEQLVFLGFAFHPLNMEILTTEDRSKVRNVFGTTVGLADAAVRSVKKRILQTIKLREPAENEPSTTRLESMDLEARKASDFLYAHFRGIC